MAARTVFGVLLVVLGGIVLAGAVVAVLWAQQQEDSGGFFGDSEREQAREAVLSGGLGAGVLGLVLLVVGIVLMATERRDPKPSTASGAGGHGSSVARDAASGAPAAAASGSTAATSAGAPSRRASSSGVSSGAAARAPAMSNSPVLPERRGRGAAIAAAIIGAGLVVVLLVALYLNRDTFGSGLFGEEGPRELGTYTANGTLENTIVLPQVGPVAAPGSDSTGSIAAPDGATSFNATLDWRPGQGGAQQLAVRLWIEVDGEEVLLAESDGAPALELSGSHEALGGAALRYEITPGELAVASQDYTLSVTFIG